MGTFKVPLRGAVGGALGSAARVLQFADSDPFIQKLVGATVAGGVNSARGGKFGSAAAPSALSYVLGAALDLITPALELHSIEEGGERNSWTVFPETLRHLLTA